MIPAITALRLTGARNRTELPLLVLGPSLGTSATALWADAAAHLTDVLDVVAWDLPGHGHNRSVPDEQFSVGELATGVLRVVDDVLAERGEVGQPFFYAGTSVGGAVGLQLMLDAPDRIASAVLLSTAAGSGDPEGWADGRGQGSVPGAPAAHEDVQVRAALARFDVRDRLAEIGVPVLAVAGAADVATRSGDMREIADGVRDGRLVVLDGLAHLAPAEEPETVARLIREHLLGEIFAEVDDDGGSALDARSRSLARLAVLLVRGPADRLTAEVQQARAHGLSAEEVDELRLLVEETA